jgi:hypothetical protein
MDLKSPRAISAYLIVRNNLAEVYRAWKNIVLPGLQYRFEREPVDWNNPPQPE